MEGYAINEKRMFALQKTVNIQTKMLAYSLDLEEKEILKAVNQYTEALLLLDQYDHQSLQKPEGNEPIYRITYEECRRMVDEMEDSFKSDVFGVEKEKGKVEGILAAVYQIMFKECLKHNVVPFIIEDNLKFFYYRGLKEWDNEKSYLMDTCLTAQDRYKAYLDYFEIKYEKN